VKGIEPSS